MVNLKNAFNYIKGGHFEYILWKISPQLLKTIYSFSGKSQVEAYSRLQKVLYEAWATKDTRYSVVGLYDIHEIYDYEKWLLKPFTNDISSFIALDFACGPGRMIKRMAKFVRRCDGIDISAALIKQAAVYCKDVPNKPNLYVSDGKKFDGIDNNAYDLIYSTIAMQHIPIHEIRQEIFSEMFRVLKPAGWISIQMAYSENFNQLLQKVESSGVSLKRKFSQWRDNAYGAVDTNGGHDIVITSESLPFVVEDLQSLGFKEVSLEFAEPPKGTNNYDKWIYIYGQKPN